MNGPAVAVVIPTRGRETRLAFALDALASQTIDNARFEVVVVRDGDWPGPRAEAPDGLEVRFLDQPGPRGPAATRNAGWRATAAPLVAFTDDDCRPASGWLAELLEAADGAPEAFVQGRTEPDPDERHLLGGLARSQLIAAPSESFETCNMAYRRALLERLGGFDESLRWVDDADLGLRARAAGAVPRFCANALVWHAVLPRQLPTAVREALRWRDVAALVSRHPEHRRSLPYRLFWKPSHARVTLGLAGLACARRRPALAAVLALPYLELHLRQYDRTPLGLLRAALDLPAQLAVDLAELGAVTGGALSHRVALA